MVPPACYFLEEVLVGFSLILSNIEDICTVKSIVKNLARDSDLYIFRKVMGSSMCFGTL